ncbi:MAG TPA: hypothetical protein VGP76_01350 [Planctomycetaceae bacterium]|jgi:hypothetical protein|nr:hypothetical protein [Planctomycetaceae bacterium]
MSQAIVGRIFWKELRVQRAFWAWILGLGAFIQLLPVFLGRAYYRTAVDFHWFYSVNVVIACCFAVGSTAIAFAGETENRTKSLFQRVPIRTADLLVGKLGWSVLGTYTLLLILALSASALSDTWGGAPTPHNAGGLAGLNSRLNDFWISLLSPLPFLVVGVFCSLGLREVLTTVMVAGAATALFMGIAGSNNWLVAIPVLAAVAVGDGLLVPLWLRDSQLGSSRLRLLRFVWPRTAPGHSTFSVRSSVAWRRAASSLVWKEWRQARGITLTLATAGALVTVFFAVGESLAQQSIGWSWTKNWLFLISIGLIAVPLVLGVAAGRADRRDGAYRLLANRGVSPSAFWLAKHAVWAGLAMATALWFLAGQRLMVGAFPTRERHPGTLWNLAHEGASATFTDSPGYIGNAAGPVLTVAVFLFVSVSLYLLGQLLSLAIPSAMTSVVFGLLGWAGIVFVWALVAELGLPFWWTIGLVPLIFLFAGWLRTRDWLVDRNSLVAWGRVAASLAVPVVGVCCAVTVFRVAQIPAVSLPLELRQPRPQRAIADRDLKQSLFIDAMNLMSPPPPTTDDPDKAKVADGWAFADARTRHWVEANELERKLALEAARKEPSRFPDEWWKQAHAQRDLGQGLEQVIHLATLLLDSARKAEAENDLEGALRDYMAAARLGDDLARSNSIPSPWRAPPTRMQAMNAMDRWAIHPKQTPELIKRAIDSFQRFEEDAAFYSADILRDWRLERQMFETYVWKGQNPNRGNLVTAETGFVRWCLPWELLRLQRLQDAMFSQSLDEMQLVERELRGRGFVDAGLITLNGRQAPWQWERTTLEVPIDCPSGGAWMSTPEWKVGRTAATRLHFLAWAVVDYRREHHKLPDKLSDLVPTYFAWLPIDPWTGRDFLYEPKGVPAALSSHFGDRLEANEPFVASAGASDCHFLVNHPGQGTAPVQVITREGRDLSTGPQFGPLQFPGPAVAIPSLNEPRKLLKEKPAKPPEKGPTKPVDRPLAKPAEKLPDGKASSKK